MRVLVTGASGSLGKLICSKLLSENHYVIGFDSLESDVENEHYSHIRASVIDKSALTSALNDCDCIVHSAVFNGDYNKTSKIAFDTNIFGTFLLYDVIKQMKNIKVVLISSAPVDKDISSITYPTIWKSHTGLDTVYDLTKRLQEEISKDYFETFGISTIVLRIGHVVDGKNNINLAGHFLSQLQYCKGGWVDKDDFILAVDLSVKRKMDGFEIFNIIGSFQAQEVYDIKRTEVVLGWKPRYQFYDI